MKQAISFYRANMKIGKKSGLFMLCFQGFIVRVMPSCENCHHHEVEVNVIVRRKREEWIDRRGVVRELVASLQHQESHRESKF